MELYKKVNYKNFVINIYYDNDAEPIRDFCDYTSVFYNNHRRYSLGGEERPINDIIKDGKLSEEFTKNNLYVPVYLYEHGGCTVSTSPFNDPWDSGLFGILAENKKSVCKEYGYKICTRKLREKIISRLKGEVVDIDKWLSGHVYGYTIEDKDGNEVDSCGGFYDEEPEDPKSNLMYYAMEAAEREIERQE